MPRPIPPYPPSEPYATTLTPVLAQLDREDRFANILRPAAWTLPLIRLLNTSTIRHAHACLAQLWLFGVLGIPNFNDHWAILTATRALGGVNADTLTEPCLQNLITGASRLHIGVFGHVYRDRTTLATALAAQKARVTATGGAGCAPFTAYLDRVVDALIPYLTP